MKLTIHSGKKVRIEMIPLIDCMFLLLVFFVYAMLSMAVHRGIPVSLPVSSSAKTDKHLRISVTVQPSGDIYVDNKKVSLDSLSSVLSVTSKNKAETSILLFADRTISYQHLYRVLDQIRASGLETVSLQAETDHQ